ncbi:MAG TPA: esterase family protein, partial [Gemmata sp.]|nr:esterase family protein [Gemmata sp.]
MRHLIPIVAYTVLAAVFLRPATAADDYAFGLDSFPHDGVPKGKVTQFKWENSKVFEGTTRDCWVYVPDQYDGKTPACVMVFQDGGGYVDDSRDFRVPVVFDNLIHRKEMPVTVGIFINPGKFPAVNK